MSVLGFAILGGKLETIDENHELKQEQRVYFNRGSTTLNPMIIPRGIEPALCKLIREDQNY